MATLPQPAAPQHKSLQININSEDDAKAVIQHLGRIKATWEMLRDTAGIDSIEFCIAETIKRKCDGFLIGAVNWCRTWVKAVAPFEGNVHFPLPHCVPAVVGPKREKQTLPIEPVLPAAEAPKVNRYLRNRDDLPAQPTGKSVRPVPAESAGT